MSGASGTGARVFTFMPAIKQIFVVHIAGPLISGIQACSRCSCVLADYRGAMMLTTDHHHRRLSHGPAHGWPLGAYVATSNHGSVLMTHDAEADDEVECVLSREVVQ